MLDLKLKVEYLRLCAAGTLTNESAVNCAFKVEERKVIKPNKGGRDQSILYPLQVDVYVKQKIQYDYGTEPMSPFVIFEDDKQSQQKSNLSWGQALFVVIASLGSYTICMEYATK